MSHEELPRVVAYIKAATRILLMGHVDPDGDAIGSLLGLGGALRRLGKEVVLAVPNAPEAKYAFIPGVGELTTQPQGDFDLFVSLDASDTLRLRGLYALVEAKPATPLVVIDHHVTNVRFGTVNWVAAEAAATSEIMVDLIDGLGVVLDRELAFPLLVGLVYDTRGFRTPTTTAHLLSLAARLIETGVPLSAVMERTMNTRPYAMMRLWGEMIEASHLEGRIAWSVLTPAMRHDDATAEGGDGGFVNYLATAQEADVGILFHDKGDGGIEVGFRAKPGINVSGVAFKLGGGGHAQAAGCTVRGNLDDIRARVLEMTQAAIADQVAHYR